MKISTTFGVVAADNGWLTLVSTSANNIQEWLQYLDCQHLVKIKKLQDAHASYNRKRNYYFERNKKFKEFKRHKEYKEKKKLKDYKREYGKDPVVVIEQGKNKVIFSKEKKETYLKSAKNGAYAVYEYGKGLYNNMKLW